MEGGGGVLGVFWEQIEKRAGKWLRGAKLLSNSIFHALNFQRYESKGSAEQPRTGDGSGEGLCWGGCGVASACAPPAPLHASHLQRLASIVETRTIFN